METLSKMGQKSYVVRKALGWDGVDPEGYVPGVQTRVVRHTLVGGRKSDPSEPGPALELRYFEVPPGAVTRLEKHEHEHYVIVGEGTADAVVGTEVRRIGPRDVVYVAPLVPHQFVNRTQETFGFFCIVSADRDPARLIEGEELARLLASPAGAVADPLGAPPPKSRV